MSNPNLIPKSITDKNGKNTTVLVNPDKGVNGKTATRVSGTVVTPSTASIEDNTNTDVTKNILEEIKDIAGWDLVSVDYRSNLEDNKDAMRAFLSGDHDTFGDLVLEGWDDSDERYSSAKSIAEELLKPHGYVWDDLEFDEQDELRFAIEEKDTSNVVQDLIRNTGQILVKYDIEDAYSALDKYAADADGEVDTDKFYHLYNAGDNYDDRVEFLSSYLDKLGFDMEDENNIKNMKSLLGEVDYDWHEGMKFGFTFEADIDDVNVGDFADGVEHTERDITFTDSVNFGIIDRWNGSGFVESFTPKDEGVTFTATKDKPVELDGDGGYGWNDITGGVYGMGTSIRSTWKTPEA